MRLIELEHRSTAIWGLGREGLAVWRAVRARWPDKPLVIVGRAADRAAVLESGDAQASWRDQDAADCWRGLDIVVKSPGISPYAAPAQRCRDAGVAITSGTALWFAERLPGLKICVTGTKGKSTTSSLIAHLLRARGLAVGLVGNIGVPLLDVLAPPLMPAAWVIELSSYQTRDAWLPDVAVVLNLFPEHLDWHGSEQRYFEDKLALVTEAQAGSVVLGHADPRLRALGASTERVRWFGRADGWHLRGGELWRADEVWPEAASLKLPGAHNALNLGAAMTAIEALGWDARAQKPSLASFRGLPHRLQPLGERGSIRYVNDSISTTPHASIAALQCFPEVPLSIIVGGHDRGVSWAAFAEHLQAHPVHRVVCIGENGAAIAALLSTKGLDVQIAKADSMQTALKMAKQGLPPGGVVLLSPGAPSYGGFRDHVDRAEAFARAAGFDPAELGRLPGLGIV